MATAANNVEKAVTSQEKTATKNKGSQDECESLLKSDCEHQRREAFQMIRDRLNRYRTQFERGRYGSNNLAEMEKVTGKMRQLAKMMNGVPIGKRVDIYKQLAKDINLLTAQINNAIRRVNLRALPFPLTDARREGPDVKKRRVDASTQKDAEKKTKTTIKQEPGTSTEAAAASSSTEAAAQQPNAAEQEHIAISDSDEDED